MPEIALLTQTPLIVLWESATGQRADTSPTPPPVPHPHPPDFTLTLPQLRKEVGGILEDTLGCERRSTNQGQI